MQPHAPREEARQFIFYSILDTFVPEESRQKMAEFMARANYDLLIGNFEMDFRDGEMRFKTSIDVEDTEENFTSQIIRQMVYANVVTTDRYFPGIMKVMYDSLCSPIEAIEHIEGAEESGEVL